MVASFYDLPEYVTISPDHTRVIVGTYDVETNFGNPPSDFQTITTSEQYQLRLHSLFDSGQTGNYGNNIDE
jgi:hypothetical protein